MADDQPWSNAWQLTSPPTLQTTSKSALELVLIVRQTQPADIHACSVDLQGCSRNFPTMKTIRLNHASTVLIVSTRLQNFHGELPEHDLCMLSQNRATGYECHDPAEKQYKPMSPRQMRLKRGQSYPEQLNVGQMPQLLKAALPVLGRDFAASVTGLQHSHVWWPQHIQAHCLEISALPFAPSHAPMLPPSFTWRILRSACLNL